MVHKKFTGPYRIVTYTFLPKFLCLYHVNKIRAGAFDTLYLGCNFTEAQEAQPWKLLIDDMLVVNRYIGIEILIDQLDDDITTSDSMGQFPKAQ